MDMVRQIKKKEEQEGRGDAANGKKADTKTT